MRRFFPSILSLFLLLLIGSQLHAFSSPFQVYWAEEPIKVKSGEAFETEILIQVPADHYIYADKTEVIFQSLEGIVIKDLQMPTPEERLDPFLGKKMSIFTGDVELLLKGEVPADMPSGASELSGTVHLQGCTPQLCLRPEIIHFSLQVEVEGVGANPAHFKGALEPAQSVGSVWELIKAQDFAKVQESGLFLMVLVVFLAGVLTSFTPCVWPLIPVTLLVVGINPRQSSRKNLCLSIALVLGMTLVYALLGTAAAMLGKSFGFLFQSKVFLALLVCFFLLMSLSMFGLFEIRIPRFLQRRLAAMGGHGYWGAFVAGLGTGLLASPCVGPVLVALLGFVVLQQSYFLGLLLLLVYGFGMGVLFVFLGLLSASVAKRVKSGPWMVWVKRLLGVLLLLPALYYFGSLTSFDVIKIFKQKSPSSIEWINSESTALRAAQISDKPVLIDFYADWCPPCRQLDQEFFTRADIQALSKQFIMWKVDGTVTSRELTAIEEKYRFFGYPTIIFLNSQAEPYEELAVSGFEPELIKEAMQRVLSDQ